MENPKLLFFINDDDQIPFDMINIARNKAFYNSAILVVDYLLDIVYDVVMNSG